MPVKQAHFAFIQLMAAAGLKSETPPKTDYDDDSYICHWETAREGTLWDWEESGSMKASLDLVTTQGHSLFSLFQATGVRNQGLLRKVASKLQALTNFVLCVKHN